MSGDATLPSVVKELPLAPDRSEPFPTPNSALGTVNSLLSGDLRLTENFPTFAPGGPN